MKRFALIGVGGYIAPRHLQAINDTKNKLIVAYDPKDSVGIMDRYFPEAAYFKDFEKFYDFLSRNKVDYVSICSPNYLHKSHIAFGLRMNADVICEKPLVLSAKDVEELADLEKSTGKKIYTVLQLRVHEVIKQFKARVDRENRSDYNIDLCYITSRGPWFQESWKGNQLLSGGLATNIGIHFFDMLNWIFGDEVETEVHHRDSSIVSGYTKLKKANVRWFLSVDRNTLPENVKANGKSTYRSITLNGEEVEFSEGFADLHSLVYKDILEGRGYGIKEAKVAVALTERMREMPVKGVNDRTHPWLLNFNK